MQLLRNSHSHEAQPSWGTEKKKRKNESSQWHDTAAQSNLSDSNVFRTMEICSRYG